MLRKHDRHTPDLCAYCKGMLLLLARIAPRPSIINANHLLICQPQYEREILACSTFVKALVWTDGYHISADCSCVATTAK